MNEKILCDVKGSKGFWKYITRKWDNGENVSLLLNVPGQPVTNEMEKAKVLNPFFISGSAIKTSLQQFQVPETHGKILLFLLVLS